MKLTHVYHASKSQDMSASKKFGQIRIEPLVFFVAGLLEFALIGIPLCRMKYSSPGTISPSQLKPLPVPLRAYQSGNGEDTVVRFITTFIAVSIEHYSDPSFAPRTPIHPARCIRVPIIA